MRERSREFTSILDANQIALPDVSWYCKKACLRVMLGTGYWVLET